MISAWDVYWVMQLDSIRGAAGLVGLAAGSLAAILGVAGAMNKSLSNDYPELPLSKRERASGEAQHRFAVLASVLATVLLLADAFLPSSKTAAAMIVLPALTSEEVTKPLAKEAGDLYRLAKRALEDAVGDDAAED